ELRSVGDLALRLGKGFAHLGGHDGRELVLPLHDEFVGTAKDHAAFTRSGFRPLLLHARAGLDGTSGVVRVAVRNGRDDLLGRRSHDVESFAGDRFDPLTVDEQACADAGHCVGNAHPCPGSRGVGHVLSSSEMLLLIDIRDPGSSSSARCSPGADTPICATCIAHEKPSVTTAESSPAARSVGAREVSATFMLMSWCCVSKPKLPATPQHPTASRTSSTPAAVRIRRWLP